MTATKTLKLKKRWKLWYSNNIKDVDANSPIGQNGVHAQLHLVVDFKKENETGKSRMVWLGTCAQLDQDIQTIRFKNVVMGHLMVKSTVYRFVSRKNGHFWLKISFWACNFKFKNTYFFVWKTGSVMSIFRVQKSIFDAKIANFYSPKI